MSTTEAKLLALIKGEAAKGPARKGGARFRPDVARASLAWMRARTSGLSAWQLANRFLAPCLLALVLWGLGTGFQEGKGADPLSARGSPEGPSDTQPFRRAPSVSLQELTRRNLFQPLVVAPPPPKAVLPPPPPPPPKVPLSQRAASLRLMGIINGGGGLQAVVEDRNRQVTRYLSAGDSIEGIRVETVAPDRVILSYEDEKLELPL